MTRTDKICLYLRQHAPDAMTAIAIAKDMGLPLKQTQRTLRLLIDRGCIKRISGDNRLDATYN